MWIQKTIHYLININAKKSELKSIYKSIPRDYKNYIWIERGDKNLG